MNLKKELAKSRRRNTMMCQSGLTHLTSMFDKSRTRPLTSHGAHLRLGVVGGSPATRWRATAQSGSPQVNVDQITWNFSKKLLSSISEPCSIRPLSRAAGPSGGRCGFQATRFPRRTRRLGSGVVFLSCGRPVTPVAIRGCLSSSSLPPSFARGRRTTVFYSGRVSQADPATSKRTRRQA